jgi:type IV pilus assembly protein PilC
MEFVCKLGTPSGDVEERRLVADDAAVLREELERKGYYVFGIRRTVSLRLLRFGRRRIAVSVLRVFTQEIATLLKAGLPLFQALDVMVERQPEGEFRRSLTGIRERIKTGVALSDAVRAEGELYPPIFAASLIAGERSGNLDTVLRRFAQYLRLNEMIKRKAISASVYPALLVVVMVAISSVLLVFVIPRFEDFYKGLGADLPALTRGLMWLGRNVKANLLLMLASLGIGVGLMVSWLSREGSPAKLDALLLHLPRFGHMMRIYATSQLAKTLATLLAGGLPLINALEVAAASIGNRALARGIGDAVPLVREGKSLTVALESTGMLENMALEMVKVGEQTGALGEMLSAIAEFYDEELETRIATTMALVEPVIIMFLAAIVALMLLAFYLPLFQSFAAMQQR